jgi:hypothetical protein
MRPRDRILLGFTSALIVIIISGPAIDVLIDPLLRHFPSIHLPFFIIAPLTLLWFFDFALGKEFCVILAICVFFVLISGGIRWWTKLSLVVAAAATCYMLLPWAEGAKHGW